MKKLFCFMLVLITVFSFTAVAETTKNDADKALFILFNDNVARNGCIGNMLFAYPDGTDYSLSGSMSKDPKNASYLFAISEDLHRMYTFLYMPIEGSGEPDEIFKEYADVLFSSQVSMFDGETVETRDGSFFDMPARLASYGASLGGIEHQFKYFAVYTGTGLICIQADYDSDAAEHIDSDFNNLLGSCTFENIDEIDFSAYNDGVPAADAVEQAEAEDTAK